VRLNLKVAPSPRATRSATCHLLGKTSATKIVEIGGLAQGEILRRLNKAAT
jgi:hypothetical protein